MESLMTNFEFQEIFQGQKYKMSVEEDGFVHRLHISNPKTDDMGKYSCDINGISTSAFLEVEGESSDVCYGIVNWQETASHKVPQKAHSTVFS